MYRVEQIEGRRAIDLLIEFDRQVFSANSERIEPEIGYWWLTWLADECVGYAGLRASRQWAETGYLCRAAVAPKHRGNGLQKRMIRARLAHAKRIGWTHCVTDTVENPASSNSLIATGFKLYEPAKPWAFKNSLYWIRKL